MFQDIFKYYQVLHIGKGVVIWLASFIMSANYVTINLFVCRILLMLFSRLNSLDGILFLFSMHSFKNKESYKTNSYKWSKMHMEANWI